MATRQGFSEVKHLLFPARSITSSLFRFSHSGHNRTSLQSIVTEMRSESSETAMSPERFMDILSEFTTLLENRTFAQAAVWRLQKLMTSVKTSDTLRAVARLWDSSAVRKDAQIRTSIRDIISTLPSHGVSSFSLESILQFATLCQRMKIESDSVFIQSLCQRVAGVSPRTSEEQVEFTSYLIKLSRVLAHPVIKGTLIATDESVVRKLTLHDLDSLIRLFTDDKTVLERLALDVDFVIKNRPFVNLLDELRTVRADTEMYHMVLGRFQPESNEKRTDPQEAVLLLHAWGRMGRVTEAAEPHLVSVTLVALEPEDTDLATILAALSKLRDHKVSTEIKTRIVEKVCAHEWTFDSPDDIEAFTSVVESLSVLNILDAALIGCVTQDIDKLMGRREPIPNVWKISIWWHSVLQGLPFDSVIPEVLTNEYPDTIRAVHELASAVLVQPTPERAWNGKVMSDFTQMLVEQHVPHTVYPLVKNSPVRTHFRIDIRPGQTVYVILSRDENDPLRVRRDSLVPMDMYKRFVHASGAKLAVVPISELGRNHPSTDIHGIVAKYVVE